jgi:hypothetical protein
LCRRSKAATPFAQFPTKGGGSYGSVNSFDEWWIGELDCEQHRKSKVDALDRIPEGLQRFESLLYRKEIPLPNSKPVRLLNCHFQRLQGRVGFDRMGTSICIKMDGYSLAAHRSSATTVRRAKRLKRLEVEIDSDIGGKRN